MSIHSDKAFRPWKEIAGRSDYEKKLNCYWKRRFYGRVNFKYVWLGIPVPLALPPGKKGSESLKNQSCNDERKAEKRGGHDPLTHDEMNKD